MTGEKFFTTARMADDSRVAITAVRTDSPHLVVTPRVIGIYRDGKVETDDSEWGITHVHSGLVLWHGYGTMADMVQLANVIAPLLDWSTASPHQEETPARVEAMKEAAGEWLDGQGLVLVKGWYGREVDLP